MGASQANRVYPVHLQYNYTNMYFKKQMFPKFGYGTSKSRTLHPVGLRMATYRYREKQKSLGRSLL